MSCTQSPRCLVIISVRSEGKLQHQFWLPPSWLFRKLGEIGVAGSQFRQAAGHTTARRGVPSPYTGRASLSGASLKKLDA